MGMLDSVVLRTGWVMASVAPLGLLWGRVVVVTTSSVANAVTIGPQVVTTEGG